MARFASSQTDINAAIGTVMDVANGTGQIATPTALTSSSPTLTAAQMVNAILRVSGQTAAQTITTDTATAIVAAVPNAQIGSTFRFILQNGHTSSGTATLSAGTGVTITNTYATAAQPITTTRQYLGIVTAVDTPAVTIYPIGQVA